ncbi:MAG: HpcH/HpaI aldolase/citrate lyase family protein [Synergistaceae bacterium]|jgi:citrate lyase subunit beta/citryl-CoA lyase|nr:HpcH/HpaI aldolase/citrate lyase family protein [Synergistaceae bacterium]
MTDDVKNRLRRTMLFLSAQRPSLMKDAYIFRPDSVIFDLEDAVAESQKDAARFSLYNNLKSVDYGSVERIVRINGLETPHWREDVRACVAGGAEGIRIAKCESAEDVKLVESAVESAEREFSADPGKMLLMAAIESPRGVINALEICEASDRLFGVAISGGDFRVAMRTSYHRSGVELLAARGGVLLAARASGVQCFDTVFTDLDDMEGFRAEVVLDREMGFDGKSVVSPRQIPVVHEIFTPGPREIREAERVVRAIRENAARGVGIFQVDGKMLDIAFLSGAERTLALAKASGAYEGDL